MPTVLPPDDLISRLKNSDDAVRGAAWQGAAASGVPAIRPLVALMADEAMETARVARRALWVVVRHVARPGAGRETEAAANLLVASLPLAPAAVRRELLWMLSEIGGDDAVQPIANLLADPVFREDARCALTRLPGRRATAALKTAMVSASEEFQFALADSLRKRGESTRGHPSQKLVPSRATQVPVPSAG